MMTYESGVEVSLILLVLFVPANEFNKDIQGLNMSRNLFTDWSSILTFMPSLLYLNLEYVPLLRS